MLWYLIRDYKSGLVYDWTNLNLVLDWWESLKFKKNNDTFKEYEIKNLYGKSYKFKFPDQGYKSIDELPKTYKDITFSWYEKVIELSNLGYVNDYTLWAHKALTENFSIWCDTTGDVEKYQLIPVMQMEEVKEIEKRIIEEEPTLTEDEIEEKVIKEISDIKRRITGRDGELMIMKERLMDYHRPDPIKYRPNKNSKEKTFQVGQDYKIEVEELGRKITIKDNYTAALRYNMFHRSLEEWNANPRYKLHQRNTLLQWWQTDAEKRMARRTVMLLPRRSWKTLLVTSEILKELLNINYKSATRPRTVLFISKDFDAVDQVMDYVNGLLKEFDWMKDMFHYDSTKHVLSLRTFDDRWKVVVMSQCKFYSALWNLPWVWDAADAVFFDEAMYIPTYVKDNLMKIVTNEWARLLVVSTFYDEDEDWGQRLYYWPVELCNKFEKESSKIVDIDRHIIKLRSEYETTGNMPDECAGLRYTIDDVDVIIHKDIAKEELADKPDSYMRQLYCRMAEKKGVLNYKPYILPVEYHNEPHPMYVMWRWSEQTVIKPQFKRIVTAYDPAQTWDISAFLATGYDEARNKIVVLKEWQLNFKDKSSFIPQADLIKEALAEMWRFNCPILKTIDSTHQAVVDVMWWQRIFFQYLYFWVGWDSVKKWVRPSEERVPKKLMVEAAQTLFDNWMVEIWDNDCKQLIEQLDDFVEFKNAYTNKSKYEWQSGHDDFVACLLMCLWTYWSHLGLSHNKFEIDMVAEYNLKKDEDTDPRWLLRSDDNKVHYTGIKNSFWY